MWLNIKVTQHNLSQLIEVLFFLWVESRKKVKKRKALKIKSSDKNHIDC